MIRQRAWLTRHVGGNDCDGSDYDEVNGKRRNEQTFLSYFKAADFRGLRESENPYFQILSSRFDLYPNVQNLISS